MHMKVSHETQFRIWGGGLMPLKERLERTRKSWRCVVGGDIKKSATEKGSTPMF